MVVACTQEKRLFAEVAEQTEKATSVIKFVNIRETGGWSKDAGAAMPKIADVRSRISGLRCRIEDLFRNCER